MATFITPSSLSLSLKRLSVGPSLFTRQLSLVHDRYAPDHSPSSSSTGPVLVLHGLYGSRQNWRSLAKGMAKALDREIVTLDLRNHGDSPHAPQASYKDMASDVLEFVDKQGWKEDLTLIGHSMGGKVAMATALSGELKPLTRLVSVDMSPARGAISPEFSSYLTAMSEITNSKAKSRKDADTILQKYEKDLGVRQFLLTNLIRSDETGEYSFRIPLEYLKTALATGEIGNFPYTAFEDGQEPAEVSNGVEVDGDRRRWKGKALFMKGSESKYINHRNLPAIHGFFPNARIDTLEAGHWVHAEQPKAFVETLVEFCK